MIFYFSCTGNTQWAARKVSDATGDRLVDITQWLNDPSKCAPYSFRIAEDEPVGFFFPVHGWRPAPPMRSFVANLRIEGMQPHTYCYAVCTAGDNIGETIDIFDLDLKKAIGRVTSSSLSLIMPESFVGLPFMDVDKPDKEHEKISHADAQLTRFVDDIKARREGVKQLVIGHWPKTNSRLLGGAFNRWIIGDSQFKVDAQRCIKCGLCSRNCPTQDITAGSGGTPVWQHSGKCISCFACYHHCPVRAIEYGKRTKGKGQYFFGKKEY